MHKLPELVYSFDALEPHIDARTMEIHYTKHHQGYVNKLNDALEGHKNLRALSVEDLLSSIDKVPSEIRQKVINFGGGHANHSLFWEIVSPKGGGEPKDKLEEVIRSTFGGFEAFRIEFSEKAMGVFGSGWAFLQVDASGELSIKRHSFQNSPLLHGKRPILVLDVWEHAYYLKYQNKRVDYVKAFWNVVDWEAVARKLEG